MCNRTVDCSANGLVSQFCSDYPLPKLFGALKLMGYRLIEAGKKVPQLASYLALQGQKGRCLAFGPQSSSSPYPVYREGIGGHRVFVPHCASIHYAIHVATPICSICETVLGHCTCDHNWLNSLVCTTQQECIGITVSLLVTSYYTDAASFIDCTFNSLPHRWM